jgi:hypothetical protein
LVGVSNIQPKEQIMARNSGSNGNQSRQAKPEFIAYQIDQKSDDKGFWRRIGAAWEHQDGKGLSLQLDFLPIDGGRIVLRHHGEANEEKGA